MKKIAIIDGDTLLYKVALEWQGGDFEYDPDFLEDPNEEDFEEMVLTVRAKLFDILEEVSCTKYRLYLTGSENFRYTFLPSYKWRRDPSKTPIALKELKAHCLESLDNFFLIEGEEADDSCTRDFSTVEEGIEKVLVHIDKDLDQVEGKHYNPDKDEIYMITPEYADNWLWTQVLGGDSADCYKGCPQVGGNPSKAHDFKGGKAMHIASGTLCVEPYLHHFTRGKNAGTSIIKWREYHDDTLTTPQRVKTWFIKGFYNLGGMGHVKGFDTTSGFKQDVKLPFEAFNFDNAGNFEGLNSEYEKFIENEIKIQYTIAYMLRCGEEIPTELHEVKF